MNNRFNRLRRLAATLALGCFVLPMAHAGEPALNAQQLGMAESALKFCGPVDPAAATKLKDKIAELLKGASDEALAKARASDEYRKAYEMMNGFTAQVDEHDAKTLCADSADK